MQWMAKRILKGGKYKDNRRKEIKEDERTKEEESQYKKNKGKNMLEKDFLMVGSTN